MQIRLKFSRGGTPTWRIPKYGNISDVTCKPRIGFRKIKIYYDIIDPKITKNLSNRSYQP